MSEAALNLSLDDLIKKQRERTKSKAKARVQDRKKKNHDKKKVTPVNVQKPGKKRDLKKGRPKQDPRSIAITVRGAGRGNELVKTRKLRNLTWEDPHVRNVKLEGGGRWDHNAFQKLQKAEKGDPRLPSKAGTKLLISNLHYEVSSEDIRDLFKPIGALVTYAVHFDHSDRSEGTAEAVFENRADAVRAMEKYNGILLDNMAMKIELIEKATGIENRLTGRIGRQERVVTLVGSGSFQRAVAGAVGQRKPPPASRKSHVVLMDE
eukprot:jgi/Picsp_1/6541/NSC_03884-R1_rna and export factor-binding protein 2-like